MKKHVAFLGIGIVAAVLFFASLADYVFPGECARLMVLWAGLDQAPFTVHPVMALFARLCGGGNAVAAVCGVVAVLAVAFSTYALFRLRMAKHSDLDADDTELVQERMAGVAALIAAAVFAVSTCTRSAANHLNTEIFDATLTLVALAVALACAMTELPALLMAFVTGIVAALALADSIATLPSVLLVLAALFFAVRCRGGRLGLALFLCIFTALSVFLVLTPIISGDFWEILSAGAGELKALFTRDESGWVILFTIVPFLVALAASSNVLKRSDSPASVIFHMLLSVAAMIVVATPFAPGSLMLKTGYLPVLSTAFAAFVAAYSVVFWTARIRCAEGVTRVIAIVFAPVVGFVVAVSAVIAIVRFDGNVGAFADRVAERIVSDLGERRWFVTDGTLDDHLRLAAQRAGRELNLVCLQRDDDEKYIESLKRLVKEKNVGGPKNEELLVSLTLGVFTFVQDWLKADPTIGDQLAVYGAPDIWYLAGVTPVSEFLFFGADENRPVDATEAWKEFDSVLEAPKGWGSYRLWAETDPLVRFRLSLRRHVGFVANNRGVWLQDRQRDDEAWKSYELVLGEIDRDNICTIFNEYEMAQRGYAPAKQKLNELGRRINDIVNDKNRRYELTRLSLSYGYVRAPEMFIRQGCAWVRSGMPGEALRQVSRAIDFVAERDRPSLMNLLASIYSTEMDMARSRQIYERVLQTDSENVTALVGLLRLGIMNNDLAMAKSYLDRLVLAGKQDEVRQERAMIMLFEDDLDGARKLLLTVVDADPADLRAWSLLASVELQRFDRSGDPTVRQQALDRLERVIVPQMEKRSTPETEFYLQTTKAFLLLRKGGEERIQEARDMLTTAAVGRPYVTATQDLVLNLDMVLNDSGDAERQAREMLRRDRKSPMANYVMGSLSMRKGDERAAESFLRLAADAEKPIGYAQNDLAEILRRQRNFQDAERYARKAVKAMPKLYVGWDTLAAVLLDAKGDLAEAERCSQKACELAGGESGAVADPRLYITLARVQAARGEKLKAMATAGKVRAQIDRLADYERKEFEEFVRSIK